MVWVHSREEPQWFGGIAGENPQWTEVKNPQWLGWIAGENLGLGGSQGRTPVIWLDSREEPPSDLGGYQEKIQVFKVDIRKEPWF